MIIPNKATTSGNVPLFRENFEKFMSYLRDPEENPRAISPKRYGSALNLDMQMLAARAHVHRNTINRSPDSESVQHYLRESLRVLHAAADVSGDVENAIFWFKNSSLPAFDYKTPENLVSEGKTEKLIQYIQSLQAGFIG